MFGRMIMVEKLPNYSLRKTFPLISNYGYLNAAKSTRKIKGEKIIEHKRWHILNLHSQLRYGFSPVSAICHSWTSRYFAEKGLWFLHYGHSGRRLEHRMTQMRSERTLRASFSKRTFQPHELWDSVNFIFNEKGEPISRSGERVLPFSPLGRSAELQEDLPGFLSLRAIVRKSHHGWQRSGPRCQPSGKGRLNIPTHSKCHAFKAST